MALMAETVFRHKGNSTTMNEVSCISLSLQLMRPPLDISSRAASCAAPATFTSSYIRFPDLHRSGYGTVAFSQHSDSQLNVPSQCLSFPFVPPAEQLNCLSKIVGKARQPLIHTYRPSIPKESHITPVSPGRRFPPDWHGAACLAKVGSTIIR
jgi:hypothetical protein